MQRLFSGRWAGNSQWSRHSAVRCALCDVQSMLKQHGKKFGATLSCMLPQGRWWQEQWCSDEYQARASYSGAAYMKSPSIWQVSLNKAHQDVAFVEKRMYLHACQEPMCYKAHSTACWKCTWGNAVEQSGWWEALLKSYLNPWQAAVPGQCQCLQWLQKSSIYTLTHTWQDAFTNTL